MSQRQSQNEHGGMGAVVLVCCAIGAITITATLTLGRGSFSLNRPSPASKHVPAIATEEYGKRLPAQTMAHLDQNYPGRAAKPVDNAYGPFADSFPLDQHRLGPYAPIEAYYKQLKKKSN